MFRICRLNNFLLKTADHSLLFHVKKNTLSNSRPLCSSSVLLNKPEEKTNQEVIYYGSLRSQIRAVKVFSLTSSIAGLIAQPIIISEATKIGSTGLIVAMCSVVGFFTFVTPVLLHFITKKYVLEMSYDHETSTFSATTMNFFCMKKKLMFTADEVDVPDIPGMFTTFVAKGRPMFVELKHFSDPTYYAKLMGYDKPMDFKLGIQEELPK